MRRDTWQALRSHVVFVNAPLERSESDSSARIGVSILRKISIGTVQIFQYRYLSKYRYFWQHYSVYLCSKYASQALKYGCESLNLIYIAYILSAFQARYNWQCIREGRRIWHLKCLQGGLCTVGNAGEGFVLSLIYLFIYFYLPYDTLIGPDIFIGRVLI